MKTELGSRILKIRQLKGLTQKEFAEPLGLTQSIVGQYETGITSPKLETLIKITSSYGIKLDWLVNGTGPMEKEPIEPELAEMTEIALKPILQAVKEYGIKPVEEASFGSQIITLLTSQLEWTRKENERLWSIIEKAGLGKLEESPIETAIAA